MEKAGSFSPFTAQISKRLHLQIAILNMTDCINPSASESTAPTTTTPPSELRALMYNCGLLRLKLFGFGPILFANPPFADERFAHLAKALLDSNADVIALQEIYEKGHVKALLLAVKETYPYHARQNNNKNSVHFQFHNGLLFLSKYPITRHETIKHRKSDPVESWLACKSFQCVEVETPGLGGGVSTNKIYQSLPF
jgi:hypothetical protein